jgi:cellobiose-specific phosphotransferase system component IIB
MKIFTIFVAIAALISAFAPSASASDEPPSGFSAVSQSQYNSSRNITPSGSDPCNARSCFYVNGQVNSGSTAGVTIGFVSTSGSSDIIRAETERTIAESQHTDVLLEKFSNAIERKNIGLINAYAILLAPRLGFKDSKDLIENMGIRY